MLERVRMAIKSIIGFQKMNPITIYLGFIGDEQEQIQGVVGCYQRYEKRPG